MHQNYTEDGEQTAEHIEALGKVYILMDYCHEHELDFDEVLDSARQSWMP